jgi:hypothetical protein
MRRIIEVLVNKSWETEPFLNAMTNPKLRAALLPFPSVINSPKDRDNRMPQPRAIYYLDSVIVVVRCIEDLMERGDNTSSSEAKLKVLPAWIADDRPDCIISVSTAESADRASAESSQNGSVYIGGAFFLYDADPNNPESHLVIPPDKTFFSNNMAPEAFALFGPAFEAKVTPRFIPAARYPAKQTRCLASPDYAAVGVINITDYAKYQNADKAARDAFDNGAFGGAKAVSIETTHGVVRLSSDAPTLFVSPITDRYQSFSDDVTDAQNYIAAFNAGIVVSEMLVELDAFFRWKSQISKQR